MASCTCALNERKKLRDTKKQNQMKTNAFFAATCHPHHFHGKSTNILFSLSFSTTSFHSAFQVPLYLPSITHSHLEPSIAKSHTSPLSQRTLRSRARSPARSSHSQIQLRHTSTERFDSVGALVACFLALLAGQCAGLERQSAIF